MVFTSPRRKQGRNVSFESKKRVCITLNSYFNISVTYNQNTSNIDNVIGNSINSCINVHTKSSINKLFTLDYETDTQLITITNNEIIYGNNRSEEISSHQNSAEVIDCTCDDNGINLLNTIEKVYATSIHSIDSTNDISMNYNDNFVHKYYAQFLS